MDFKPVGMRSSAEQWARIDGMAHGGGNIDTNAGGGSLWAKNI